MNQAEHLEYISMKQNKCKSEESEASSHGRRVPTEYRVCKYLKNTVFKDDLRKHRKIMKLNNLSIRIARIHYEELEYV